MKHRLLFSFFFLPIFLFAQQTEFKGKIIDAASLLPMPYVNVGIQSKAIGTVTNLDGYFRFSLADTNSTDSIVCTHIGYQTLTLGLDAFQKDTLILQMSPSVIALDEVKIYPLSPEEILTKVIENIPYNYPSEIENYQLFFREWISSNLNGFLREGAFSYNNQSYHNNLEALVRNYPIQLKKGRQYNYIVEEEVKQVVGVGVGPYGCVNHDIIKTIPPQLHPNTHKWFDYHIKGLLHQDTTSFYVIEYLPKKKTKERVNAGTLYINANNYALVKTETYIPEHTKKYYRPNLIGRMLMKTMGISYTIENVKEITLYQYNAGKYRPSYTQIDGYVKVKRPKKNQYFDLTINSQMSFVKTDSDSTNWIQQEERFNGSGFENVTGTYASSYWNNYQIIEPSESLRQILDKIRIHAEQQKKE